MSACISCPALQHGQVIVFLQKLYTRVIAEKLCPQGRTSFEWSGLSCRNGVSGMKGSLEAPMDSSVNGHSSSSFGMERTTSTVCRLGFTPLLLNVSFVGLEKSL